MSIFSGIFKRKNEKEQEIKQDINIIEHKPEQDDDEITAVIAAVVASMDEEEETVAAITAAISVMLGKSTNDFIVRNIRRTSEIDSLWALKGRMKLMR